MQARSDLEFAEAVADLELEVTGATEIAIYARLALHGCVAAPTGTWSARRARSASQLTVTASGP